jgi:hypothetical protein
VGRRYSCHALWQIGGDDETFARLSEIDALPGSDVSAFRNLRDFAYLLGYVQPTTWTDAGPPPPPPHVDGGPHVSVDAGVAFPHHP